MTVNKPPPKKAPAAPAVAGAPPATGKAPAPPATAAKAAAPVPPAAAKAPGAKPAGAPVPPKATKAGAAAAPVKAGVSAKPGTPAKPGAKAQPTAPPQDNRKVEEKVFSALKIKDATVPALFTDFIEKIVPKVNLPRTSAHILEAFANIDVKAERVAQILKGNPYYEDVFFRIIESLGKTETVTRLEGALVLVGMQGSRNTVIGLQMLRTARGLHPEWSKEGKLKFSAGELLKYALRTEEALDQRRDSYADTAYAAGLIFDILSLLAVDLAADKKKALAFIDATYAHGLRTALIGAEIAKAVQDTGFKKFVFSACLIHDIGKIVMAILDPTYLAFLEECTKKELPRHVRLFAETQRFGVNHAMLGGLCCEYFHTFQPIEKAIYFHHEPYLIQGEFDGLDHLASLICLATNVANNFKKIEKTDDPVMQLWKGRELEGFEIDPQTLIDAVEKVN